MKSRKLLALAISITALAATPAVASAGTVFGGGQLAGNGLNVFTFNMTTPATGTASVIDIQSGNRITGTVSCVNVSGNQASFIVLVDPTLSQGVTNVVAQLFYVADNGFDPASPTDAQRNGPLTAKQLIKLGGPSACPDPTTPPKALTPIVQGDITVQP